VTPLNEQTLLDLRGRRDYVGLSEYVNLLRANGWTYQQIADVFGIRRQAVHQWRHSDRLSALPCDPRPRKPNPMPSPPKVQRLKVRPEVADRLRELHELARTVNGPTPLDDPRRDASKELSMMLASLKAQGVAAYSLAQVLGVTHAAINMRLQRHGYAERTYRQTKDKPLFEEHPFHLGCRHGSDTKRYSNGSCKACNAASSAEYYAKHREEIKAKHRRRYAERKQAAS
jgi:predicted transcriptional regulator